MRREQARLLRRAFTEVLGAVGAEVVVETIDSCQGREFDVVIFSCVRAAAAIQPRAHDGALTVAEQRRLAGAPLHPAPCALASMHAVKSLLPLTFTWAQSTRKAKGFWMSFLSSPVSKSEK